MCQAVYRSIHVVVPRPFDASASNFERVCRDGKMVPQDQKKFWRNWPEVCVWAFVTSCSSEFRVFRCLMVSALTFFSSASLGKLWTAVSKAFWWFAARSSCRRCQFWDPWKSVNSRFFAGLDRAFVALSYHDSGPSGRSLPWTAQCLMILSCNGVLFNYVSILNNIKCVGRVKHGEIKQNCGPPSSFWMLLFSSLPFWAVLLWVVLLFHLSWCCFRLLGSAVLSSIVLGGAALLPSFLLVLFHPSPLWGLCCLASSSFFVVLLSPLSFFQVVLSSFSRWCCSCPSLFGRCCHPSSPFGGDVFPSLPFWVVLLRLLLLLLV